MPRTRALIDASTGEVTYVPFTAAEEAQADIDAQEGLVREQAAAQREQERQTLRAVYVALRDGTGTAGERIQRLERVVAWMMRKDLGAN